MTTEPEIYPVRWHMPISPGPPIQPIQPNAIRCTLYAIPNSQYASHSVFCFLSSVLTNKPNFQKSQMNVSIYLQTAYENKRDWTLGENKPNSNPIKPNLRKVKMNVNLTLTKDYRKNDDFAVRKNKPNSKPVLSAVEWANFFKDQNERKLICYRGLWE